MPRDRAQRRGHPLAGHMPRQLKPINQLIPQVLPTRAHAVHSRQYLRLNSPQRSVVQRGDHAAWAFPCPSGQWNTARSNMEGYRYARNTLSPSILHRHGNNVLPCYLLVVVSSIAADDAARP